MYYHFKIHQEGNGFWAECLELEGCDTQAEDMEQLQINMSGCVNLYLSEPVNSQVLFPLPGKYRTSTIIQQIEVEPKVAFSFLIRRYRLIHNLTQAQVAEKLGLKNLWSYQRLEKSSSANPTLSTLNKLQNIFPDLELNRVFK